MAKPGGGGYGNSYGGYGSGYRSGGGVRWGSFGAGMVAYGVMSSLASRGHYHSGGGYYYRNNYGSNTHTKPKGKNF
ncbi:MAG: hypothetical protein WCK82_15100 [Bacteroidota bacterium]